MVNGTLIWYYFQCKREVWLMARKITPAQDHANIEIGRHIHEKSYKKNKKEIVIGNIKFDVVKQKNSKLIVGEIKKSSKFEKSSMYQLYYYLYELEKAGVNASGELLFPEERKKISVELTNEIKAELDAIVLDIESIAENERAPKANLSRLCSVCAYAEYCWA